MTSFAIVQEEFLTGQPDDVKRTILNNTIDAFVGFFYEADRAGANLKSVMRDASGPIEQIRIKGLNEHPFKAIVYCFEKVMKDYQVTSAFNPFDNGTHPGCMPNQVKLKLYTGASVAVALTLGDVVGAHEPLTFTFSETIAIGDCPLDRHFL